MPQYDRRSDDRPLTFDSRQPVRSGGPAPVTLVLSLLLLAVIGAGVFFLYKGGMRGASDAPQPVGTPIAEVRTAAPAEPQSAEPGAGLSIYKDTTGPANTVAPAPVFAPPPETPLPRPTAAAAPTPAATTAAPSPAPTKPGPPSPKAAAPAPSPAKAVVVASAAASSPSAPEAAAAKTETPTAAAVVQIGAFSSSQQADEGWNAAAEIAPAAMAGKGKKVVTVAKDGATLYRTSITGFASREEAQALCAKLQGAGKTCFVR
jgi:cell division protein FtsN